MFTENRQKISKGFDIPLILLYIALVTIGWLTIFSSSYDASETLNIFNINKAYGRQMIWIGTSILLAIVILVIDSRFYQHFAYHIYLICLLLMIAVLFIGTERGGGKSWFGFGSFGIQPAEFAKFATALALAKFLNEGKTRSERKNVWLLAFLFILIPIFIIMLQRDTGSALVFFSFIILFYREGMSGYVLLIIAFAILLFLITLIFNELYATAFLTVIFIVLWIIQRKDKKKLVRNAVVYASCILFVFLVNISYNHVFQAHQKQRIDTLLGKTADPRGADFNLNQSKIAIGSGGLFGKGYLKGTQTKLNFVPEQSTDFIFCGIGEEWGFFGSAVLLSLFMALIIRIILLAEKQRNSFTRMYGYGIASVIFFHLIINIGMTIGLVPVIGIPLPFLSYGGSSLWAFTIMLFIFIKLDSSRNSG